MRCKLKPHNRLASAQQQLTTEAPLESIDEANRLMDEVREYRV